MGARLGGDALRLGSGGEVESRKLSILTVSTRAARMGFAYGLEGPGKITIPVFLIRLRFRILFFSI